MYIKGYGWLPLLAFALLAVARDSHPSQAASPTFPDIRRHSPTFAHVRKPAASRQPPVASRQPIRRAPPTRLLLAPGHDILEKETTSTNAFATPVL